MQRMYFRDGGYRPKDINLTVRHGKYWSQRLKIGDEFIFWQTGTKLENRPIMKVVGIVYVPYDFLIYMKDWVSLLHHADLDYYEIKDELFKIKSFDIINDDVTLIFFTVSI